MIVYLPVPSQRNDLKRPPRVPPNGVRLDFTGPHRQIDQPIELGVSDFHGHFTGPHRDALVPFDAAEQELTGAHVELDVGNGRDIDVDTKVVLRPARPDRGSRTAHGDVGAH